MRARKEAVLHEIFWLMSSSTNTTGMRRGTERADLGFIKALRILFAELLGTLILTVVTLAGTMIAAKLIDI